MTNDVWERFLSRHVTPAAGGYFFDMPERGCLVLSLLPEPGEFARGVDALVARLSSG